MNRIIINCLVILGILMIVGCSATTSLSSAPPRAIIDIKDSKNSGNPRTEKLSTTSFGNYEFRVTGEGKQQLFGILPLKFNGGYLAADILFFAPATFFNLREVYPFYEFDLEKSVVKYKKDKNDPWISYSPSSAESNRAKSYFLDK